MIINGDEQNNDLQGSAGADQIYAGAGSDRVEAQSGADEIYGGDGRDSLYGDRNLWYAEPSPDETIYGGSGDDFIGLAGIVFTESRSFGSLAVYGGSGDDTLFIDGYIDVFDNDFILGETWGIENIVLTRINMDASGNVFTVSSDVLSFEGLCCTNQLTVGSSLSQDRPIPRPS